MLGSTEIHRASVGNALSCPKQALYDITNICEVPILLPSAPNHEGILFNKGSGNPRDYSVRFVLPLAISREYPAARCLHPVLSAVCPKRHLSHELGPAILTVSEGLMRLKGIRHVLT